MYVLKKDGLWLMNYQSSMRKEITSNGKLETVPNCLWGEHFNDAMTIEHEAEAMRIALIVGADIMKIKGGCNRG